AKHSSYPRKQLLLDLGCLGYNAFGLSKKTSKQQ
ncbi:hypothetical protein DERP_006801, partial [Dermatophagoides pteronyssinus]